jgi:transcriptional regulator with XRE-family HTH domain
VEFRQKLQQIIEQRGLTKARLAQAADLTESTVSSYFTKRESMPRLDIAMKLCRVLKVPLDWLADDSQGWPPPAPSSPNAAIMTDDELMAEVARRYRLQAIRIRGIVDGLKAINWEKIATALFQQKLTETPTPDIDRLFGALFQVSADLHFAVGAYDPRIYADQHHPQMPGAALPVEKLNLTATLMEWMKFGEKTTAAELVQLYWNWRENIVLDPPRAPGLEKIRLQLWRQIKAGNFSTAAVVQDE